jgi:hypothetical protein
MNIFLASTKKSIQNAMQLDMVMLLIFPVSLLYVGGEHQMMADGRITTVRIKPMKKKPSLG